MKRSSTKCSGIMRLVKVLLSAAFLLVAAETVRAQATFQVINNFNGAGATYFGNTYTDAQVWLFFINTGTNATYTDNTGASKTVVDNQSIQFSKVKNGTFHLAVSESGARIYAGLGSVSPFLNGTGGPGPFDENVPYAVAEWTINGNANDNTDMSYIDQFTLPTILTVYDAGGSQTAQSGFPAGTQANYVIAQLKAVMPSEPQGPPGSMMPQPGDGQWGPFVTTIAGSATAQHCVGSSKYNNTAADGSNLRTMYLYAPSFNDYLGYLQANEPTLFSNKIKGWYIDYSGNGGYSGYLSITGTDHNYGMLVHDIRVNTNPSAANNWMADPTAGTVTSGNITVAANSATLPFVLPNTAPDGTNVQGWWTDAVIYSGAALMSNNINNTGFGDGPVITGTGDFAPGGVQYNNNGIISSIVGSVSASMASGLMGSEMYLNKIKASTPGSTMYWFNEMPRAQSLTSLFGKAWPGGQKFYDPFWAEMTQLTGMQGYLSPYNDRWSNFSPDFGLPAPNYSITWQLGLKTSSIPATLSMAASPAAGGTTNPSVGTHEGYHVGQAFTITASPADGYHFTSWTASGNIMIKDLYQQPTTATLTGAAGTATANFAQNTSTGTLTVAVSPEAGGTTVPAKGEYTKNVGAPISILALPATDYHFTGWTKSGDATIVNPGEPSTNATLTSTSGGTVTANFAQNVNDVVLTMAVSPITLGVTTPSIGVHSYPDGDTVPIIAEPADPDTHHFITWKNSGSSKIADISNPRTTVILSGDDTVTAVFEPNVGVANHTMAVFPAEGGSVSPGTGVHLVVAGKVFPIQAAPANGYYFAGWTASQNGLIYDVTLASTTGEIADDATFTANFTQVPVTFLAKGAVFELDKADIGIEQDFTSGPSIFAVYTDPVKNKPGVSAKFTNITKPSKKSPQPSVVSEWVKNQALYDKKNFSGKESTAIELLLQHPVLGILSTSMNVKYKELQTNPTNISKAAYIAPPVVSSVSGPHSQSGDIFILQGKYFSAALPTVYFEYSIVKSGVTSYAYKKCKVLKKDAEGASTLLFSNAKGKLNSSCMKILEDQTAYDIGFSQIQVEYPTLKNGETLTGYIKLVNGAGLDVFYISNGQ